MGEGNRDLRVGLVGAGNIANRHADAIAATPGVALVGVTDRDAARAQSFAESKAIPRVFESWEALLDDDSIDVVAITAPPDVHADLAEEAMAAGHHVVCEKPLGRTVAECDRMLRAASATGKRLLPGHNRVFDAGVERMADIVRGGQLGEVFLAQSNGLEPPALLERIPWLRTELSLGGVLLAQAVHPFYVLRWLLGDGESVIAAKGGRNTVEMTREDTAAVTVELRSGALAVFTATFAVAHGPLDHEISLFGTEGWLRATRRPHGKEHLWGVVPALFGDDEERELPLPGGDSFARMWANHRDALRDVAVARQDAGDGRAAVEIVQAAYRSMAEGARIPLPLA